MATKKTKWEIEAQKEMESKSNQSVDRLIETIKANGGQLNVVQLMDQLELDCPKKVRRPFQKAGLKGETLAKEINGHKVVLDKSTKPQTYKIIKYVIKGKGVDLFNPFFLCVNQRK